jgi:SAM-dependent methyltransferase
MYTDEKAITLGHPSYVWRAGQERRFYLIRRYAALDGARILDVGCGLGLYVQRFRAFSTEVHGIDIDPEKVREASQSLPNIQEGSAQALPYPNESFDLVLSHEVLEHVPDDVQAVHEAYRVLRRGGHLVVFAPNRYYPFETHGIYWRGRYHYGNIPLVNYLPDGLRAKLCPHVRAYTARGLRRLFVGLLGHVVVHQCIFAGYDNIDARYPALGALLKRSTYALENTPLQILGLSHFLVYARD